MSFALCTLAGQVRPPAELRGSNGPSFGAPRAFLLTSSNVPTARLNRARWSLTRMWRPTARPGGQRGLLPSPCPSRGTGNRAAARPARRTASPAFVGELPERERDHRALPAREAPEAIGSWKAGGEQGSGGAARTPKFGTNEAEAGRPARRGAKDSGRARRRLPRSASTVRSCRPGAIPIGDLAAASACPGRGEDPDGACPAASWRFRRSSARSLTGPARVHGRVPRPARARGRPSSRGARSVVEGMVCQPWPAASGLVETPFYWVIFPNPPK